MKITRKATMAIVIFISAFSSQSFAAESWWNRVKNVLSQSDEIQMASELTSTEISDAFKQALSIGSEKVVDRLGKSDAFNTDPAIHIALPDELDKVKNLLARVGFSGFFDDLELQLNRAAEASTPIAKELFLQAISEMSFEDAKNIYQGPEDSATRYFQEKMSPSLQAKMAPIVKDSLAQVGAANTFDKILSKYQELPLAPKISTDLTSYAVDKAMAGIFFYIAQEEAMIRENPVAQTTDLLKKVFGKKAADSN